jgi:general secretion pathway protein J
VQRVRSSAAGFTLIEVLIALAITALVAMLSFSSLSSVLTSVEVLRDRGQRISELNRAWTLVSRDLTHFVARPVRDEFGQAASAMRGGAAVTNGISFTRGGWHNPNQQLRSQLQRVRYRLEDDVLWRESFTVLDRTSESEPQRVQLLTGVDDFQLAFLGAAVSLRGEELDTEDWPDNWGVSASTTGAVGPPEALELTLQLQDWGEVRWLYDLPPQ